MFSPNRKIFGVRPMIPIRTAWDALVRLASDMIPRMAAGTPTAPFTLEAATDIPGLPLPQRGSLPELFAAMHGRIPPHTSPSDCGPNYHGG